MHNCFNSLYSAIDKEVSAICTVFQCITDTLKEMLAKC